MKIFTSGSPKSHLPQGATAANTNTSNLWVSRSTILIHCSWIFPIFLLYSLRIVVVPWMWDGPGEAIFLPVVSPVYRQGEHWLDFERKIAIFCHIMSGAVVFGCLILQFDKHIRNYSPTLHRWTGRIYVLSGMLCMTSLLFLSPSMGAGSSTGGHSSALVLIVDITIVLWFATTAIAVLAVMWRRFELHRDAMGLSMCLCLSPVSQRGFSWAITTPLAVTARCLICILSGLVQGQQAAAWPWQVRWGPPGSTASLLLGACAEGSESLQQAQALDPRACPYVLSFDGYGEGEQASLALSAWIGVTFLLILGSPPLLGHIIGERVLKMPDIVRIPIAIDDVELRQELQGLQELSHSTHTEAAHGGTEDNSTLSRHSLVQDATSMNGAELTLKAAAASTAAAAVITTTTTAAIIGGSEGEGVRSSIRRGIGYKMGAALAWGWATLIHLPWLVAGNDFAELRIAGHVVESFEYYLQLFYQWAKDYFESMKDIFFEQCRSSLSGSSRYSYPVGYVQAPLTPHATADEDDGEFAPRTYSCAASDTAEHDACVCVGLRSCRSSTQWWTYGIILFFIAFVFGLIGFAVVTFLLSSILVLLFTIPVAVVVQFVLLLL